MTDQRDQVLVYVADHQLGGPVPVGRLSHVRARLRETYSFEYLASWWADDTGFPLDPALPLVPGEMHFPSLPGVFRDAAPDRWGQTLLQRRERIRAHDQGQPPRVLGDWEYLLRVDDETRLGAIRLQRPSDNTFVDRDSLPVPPVTVLRELQAAASAIQSGEDADKRVQSWIRMLLAPGSSLGGARPKATYRDQQGQLWFAKFPSATDHRDVGAWEHLLSDLAERAGIEVADHALLALGSGHHTFAARRFDRTAGGRRLYCSAMTLTGRSDREVASYLEIADAIRRHGHPGHIHEDLSNLFTRVVFNVLTGNRDDHLRNHGFLHHRDGQGQGWRLSPAFDLNPSPDSFAHALLLDEGSALPDIEVVRATAEWYGLRTRQAEVLIQLVASILRGWRRAARAAGISGEEVEETAAAFSALRNIGGTGPRSASL